MQESYLDLLCRHLNVMHASPADGALYSGQDACCMHLIYFVQVVHASRGMPEGAFAGKSVAVARDRINVQYLLQLAFCMPPSSNTLVV